MADKKLMHVSWDKLKGEPVSRARMAIDMKLQVYDLLGEPCTVWEAVRCDKLFVSREDYAYISTMMGIVDADAEE